MLRLLTGRTHPVEQNFSAVWIFIVAIRIERKGFFCKNFSLPGGHFGRGILPLFGQRFCGIVRGKGTFSGRGIKCLGRAGLPRS